MNRRQDDGNARTLTIAVVAALALIVGLGAAPVASQLAEQPVPGEAPVATGPWTRPVTSGEITSGYGRRCLGGGCRLHSGTDIAVPSGTPVLAASSGRVEDARCTSPYCDRPGYLGLGGYGNLLTLSHADGLTTRYAHLTSFTVAPGDTVTAGQLVGYAGSTGNSTGPHLHFEVLVDGAFTDPEPFMAERNAPLGETGGSQ